MADNREVEVRLFPPGPRLFWCNSHQRKATHINMYNHTMVCDPKLGGIMLPCSVVDLTDECVLDEGNFYDCR